MKTFCLHPIFMSIRTNKTLKFVAKEITRKSFKKMLLSKADMKTNFLNFSMSMSVKKLVCKCDIEFCGEIEKNFKSLQKLLKKSFG